MYTSKVIKKCLSASKPMTLGYYLLDHMYALYIQISHMIAFTAPKNNEFTTLKIALLTDTKFFEGLLAVYVGCHRGVIVI